MPAVTGGKVAIFGAGGPVAVAATRVLREHYMLRLTDMRPLAEIIAANQPQSRGAPLPELLPPPHEERQVDVTDYAQVLEAARGMDALVNCSVIRRELGAAFLVNLTGAYHVAKAAVELGITRIIHTGPQLVITSPHIDYSHDFEVDDDVPERPSGLYGITKYLGGEVMRIFAERHGLEVVSFVYCAFRPAEWPEDADGSGVHPFSVAWEDAGEVFLYGLRALSSALERPMERFLITSRQPQGKYGNSGKAERLLGWSPRHDFARLWTRGGRAA